MSKDKNQRVSRVMTRRQAIGGMLASAPLLLSQNACERHRYIRPPAELDLGPVKELLYARVHVPIKAVLVYRDADGWSALSTRCSYEGCDLTHQEPVLLCPCCRTRYSLDGRPHPGWSATRNLPWIDVYYKDGHLYGNPGKPRSPKWRFTTPEIEEAIRKLRKRVKTEKLKDEVTIPDILTGQGDRTVGTMFLEDDPNLMHELDMIR